MYFDHNRLDTPPPPSLFRRPWSPDPNDPLPSTRNLHNYNRREPSDVSIEALDLADYAMTLQPHFPYPPSPPSMRPFSSRNTLPSLSRGETLSSNSLSSHTPIRHPFSVSPPLPTHYERTSPHSNVRDKALESDVDISHFPAWSRSWYDSPPITKLSDPIKFDPMFPAQPTSYSTHGPHLPNGSTRDILPWTDTVPEYEYGASLDVAVREERMRMLEREFGGPGMGALPADTPTIGSVDARGRLVTQGPKKRTATRVAQIVLALGTAISSIYAALVIKPPSTPPPQSKLPAYVMYILSVVTTLVLVFLFVFRPCFCRRRKKGSPDGGPMANGMMVLPIQGLPGPKNGKNKKRQKGSYGDGVQVNLIVDPSMFGRSPAFEGHDDDYATTEDSSVPGGFSASTAQLPPRRRGIFAGLAMEEEWRHARSWLKRTTFVDGTGLLLWSIEFVLVLLGKRCPSGAFGGWCDAYNIASAAACLLCIAFGVSVFFGIKDLHDSRASPRTRP